MRDRLIELFCEVNKRCAKTKDCSNCVGYEKGAYCKHYLLADHLLAEGVIVPPCKVGDIIYDIYDGENIREIKVAEINTRLDKRNKPWLIIGGYYYAFSDFGETVFFTREEAEKALERSENGK